MSNNPITGKPTAPATPATADALVPATRLDAVVIGAGQAGLAIGYFLARQGRHFLIVEAADAVGAAWRDRWDSLVLFTPRRHDALPGLAFPGDSDGYPTRDEVTAYLDQYAARFDLPIEFNKRVSSLSLDDGCFRIEADGQQFAADQVVVATGPFGQPRTPPFAGQLAPEVFQMHSAAYRRPSDVPGGRVLVVGGGNTGFQIARELSASHAVHLAIGSSQTPLPQRLLGRDIFWWLTKLGMLETTVDSWLGRLVRDRETLIGSSPRELERKYGVTLMPRVVGASGRTITFAEGRAEQFDAVIWATGYRPDYSWINLPVLNRDGRLRHRRGVTDVPGLYFLGLAWQHTRGSALLGWVKDDAEFIAARIEAGARSRVAAPTFSSSVVGLPNAVGTKVLALGDGDTIDLRIAPVVKQLGPAAVRMLAYNGSVPGPTLSVSQGSTLVVNVANQADLDATVHWHGLRVDNRYDGTHQTQAPIPPGKTFLYRIEFPDPGIYWYHPHIREDYGQEMGLYGNILVVPADENYWPRAHRDVLLTLDDVLIEDGKIASFRRTETNYTAMGRFGNVILVGGETALSLGVRVGEVIRFYLTNTANTRVFNVALPGARIKLVGGDSGRFEREEFVNSVILAPSERVVIDALFSDPGQLTLEHRTPARRYPLATIDVGTQAAEPSLAEQFAVLRHNTEWVAERERLAPYFDAPPDKTLGLVAEMAMDAHEGPVVYTCPTHPDVVSDAAGRCPKCGMKLLPAATVAGPAGRSEHGSRDRGREHHQEHADRNAAGPHRPDHQHAPAHRIEWEDDMVDVNRSTTPANMHWRFVDRATGAVNHAIDWRFRVGDRVKLRLINEMDSDHPMHHPFHIHGAGRFVVLARDGVTEQNLVWKDTVLIRTGETVDILLDITNPGLWMAHCHIAEHHESGMMFSFTVAPADAN